MKRSIFVLAILLGLMALPSVAFAQVELHGSGYLHAEGNGHATLVMQAGNVTVSGHGELVIAIRDNATIRLSGEGTCQDSQRDNLTIKRCRGFNGQVHVSGTGYAVRIQGRNIVLDARGQGHAYLRGNGWYEVNGRSGQWSDAEQEISIKADS